MDRFLRFDSRRLAPRVVLFILILDKENNTITAAKTTNTTPHHIFSDGDSLQLYIYSFLKMNVSRSNVFRTLIAGDVPFFYMENYFEGLTLCHVGVYPAAVKWSSPFYIFFVD